MGNCSVVALPARFEVGKSSPTLLPGQLAAAIGGSLSRVSGWGRTKPEPFPPPEMWSMRLEAGEPQHCSEHVAAGGAAGGGGRRPPGGLHAVQPRLEQLLGQPAARAGGGAARHPALRVEQHRGTHRAAGGHGQPRQRPAHRLGPAALARARRRRPDRAPRQRPLLHRRRLHQGVRVPRGRQVRGALLPALRPLRLLLGQRQRDPEPHGADGRVPGRPGLRPWRQLLQRQPGFPGDGLRGRRARRAPAQPPAHGQQLQGGVRPGRGEAAGQRLPLRAGGGDGGGAGGGAAAALGPLHRRRVHAGRLRDALAGGRGPKRQRHAELPPVESDRLRLPEPQARGRHPLPPPRPARGQLDSAGVRPRPRLLRRGPGQRLHCQRHQHLLRRRGRRGLPGEALPELVGAAGLRAAPPGRLLAPRHLHRGCGAGCPRGAAAGGQRRGPLRPAETLLRVRAHQLSCPEGPPGPSLAPRGGPRLPATPANSALPPGTGATLAAAACGASLPPAARGLDPIAPLPPLPSSASLGSNWRRRWLL